MATENHKYTNNLINESSPYLLQHAHNPVYWYAWGDEAFAESRIGKEANLSVHRILNLPLVPCNGT